MLRAARALNMHRDDAYMHQGRANLHGDQLIFPGRGGQTPLGEGTINALYGRTAFAGRHVVHGWRATFSTVMNSRRREDRFVIDSALGHALKREDGSVAKVEAAYNRDQQIDARRNILEEWAEILTS